MESVMMNDKDWKYKLTKLELHNEGNEYYLEAEYDTENTREKGIIHIPKIPLYIAKTPKIDLYMEEICDRTILRKTCCVDLGFGDISLRPNEKEPYYTYRVTEKKVKEMSLEEIEKQLGYKVKIVSKEA